MAWKIRLSVAVALTIVVAVPAAAEENFKLLKAKQIRATIAGKDISDDVHWSEYYRKDGALISTDIGTKQTGTWKIQGDKLCKSKENTKTLTCYEVWMSGENISLRLHEGDDHFIGVVEKHTTD
ncbi:MAG TPA: hypothetical protein VIE66_11620 [Methylocella sp.]|jgi:hypothetical protein